MAKHSVYAARPAALRRRRAVHFTDRRSWKSSPFAKRLGGAIAHRDVHQGVESCHAFLPVSGRWASAAWPADFTRVQGVGSCCRSARDFHYPIESSGAWGRIRTTDTRIFSPLLYQLSYPGPCTGTIERPRPGEPPSIGNRSGPVQRAGRGSLVRVGLRPGLRVVLLLRRQGVSPGEPALQVDVRTALAAERREGRIGGTFANRTAPAHRMRISVFRRLQPSSSATSNRGPIARTSGSSAAAVSGEHTPVTRAPGSALA